MRERQLSFSSQAKYSLQRGLSTILFWPYKLFKLKLKELKMSNHPLPRGIRNNNPGNLNFMHQKGAVLEPGSDARFAKFPSSKEGLKALAIQLVRYYNVYNINTIKDIVSKWAPSSDNNNTTIYAKNVARYVNTEPTTQIKLTDLDILTKIMEAIILMENGQNPYGNMVRNAAYEVINSVHNNSSKIS